MKGIQRILSAVFACALLFCGAAATAFAEEPDAPSAGEEKVYAIEKYDTRTSYSGNVLQYMSLCFSIEREMDWKDANGSAITGGVNSLDWKDNPTDYLFRDFVYVNGRRMSDCVPDGWMNINACRPDCAGPANMYSQTVFDCSKVWMQMEFNMSHASEIDFRMDGTDVVMLSASLPVDTCVRGQSKESLGCDYYFQLKFDEQDRPHFEQIERPAVNTIARTGLRVEENLALGFIIETDAVGGAKQDGLDDAGAAIETLDFKETLIINGKNMGGREALGDILITANDVSYLTQSNVYMNGARTIAYSTRLCYLYTVKWEAFEKLGLALNDNDVIGITANLRTDNLYGKTDEVKSSLDKTYYFRLDYTNKELLPLTPVRFDWTETESELAKPVESGSKLNLPANVTAQTPQGPLSCRIYWDWDTATAPGNKEITGTVLLSQYGDFVSEDGFVTVRKKGTVVVTDTILSLEKIADSKKIAIGEEHTLPSTVKATLQSGGTVDLNIVWNWTKAESAGNIAVIGTIEAEGYTLAEGVSLTVNKTVKVSKSGGGCKSAVSAALLPAAALVFAGAALLLAKKKYID